LGAPQSGFSWASLAIKVLQFLVDPRPTATCSQAAAPVEAKPGAVPANDRFGFDGEEDLRPAAPEATEGGPEQAIASVQPRSGSLALEHCDLLAQSEDFQSGVGSRAEEHTERHHNSEEELGHELRVVTRRNTGLIAEAGIFATH